MESIVDYNMTKEVLYNKYNKEAKKLKKIEHENEKMYLYSKYIEPLEKKECKYPHVNKERYPEYSINDNIFRNANSNVKLGYCMFEK